MHEVEEDQVKHYHPQEVTKGDIDNLPFVGHEAPLEEAEDVLKNA